jgi:error-prone DNA polymerase
MYHELHARSAFSFLEGASLPEELMEVCANSGMKTLALLDRDGVYGSARAHLAAKKLDIRAIVGSEVTTSFDCHPERGRNSDEGPAVASNSLLTTRNSQLPLLVHSRTGYQNLCRLITQMKLRVPKHAKLGEARVTQYELQRYAEGLVCLTGGDNGPLAQALARGGINEGLRTVESLTHIFGHDNVYIELQRHYDRTEEARNRATIEIARSLKLPLLATNGVRHARPEQRQVLDLFTCIRNHCSLDQAGRLLSINSERHLKTPEEMSRLFADIPEAIANTEQLSAQLNFELSDLGYQFPRYPVPEGETMMSFLRERTREGARDRYLKPNKRELWPRAQRQIERELSLIEKLDLAGYFLIVWDLVRFCRENNILAQGRGSAANSAVCYSLGITAIDPIGMELLFERFLSEERGEWPDIDLDLPSGDDRERVIQYVYQSYGKLGAAMTANVITYRGRSAAREVGKALGFDPDTTDRLSKMVGSWEYKGPDETLEKHFREAGSDLRHPRMMKYLELCMAIQDLPRHLGQHSGGMVICQGQLDSVVPLEAATMPGRVVVQWDKEDCADMGIIKVDLLGLGMMAVLKDCLELIPRHYKEDVDLAHLPANDPDVYAALQKADTVGMFQVESRAQMACLPRLHPTNFYDIVIQIALIRPGPIVGEMVNPYIKRRQGREEVKYAHPALEPILERTLGVPLFQEQLLRIAMVGAGFTGGEAEELRRALGAKRSEKRMREIEVKLRRGMERNGISKQAQDEIVQSIVSFALYGFPESHAASFALIAYASAYLKTHYLAAFTAAMLNNQPMGFYHPSTLVKDAQRHGLKVRPIDVLRSKWECTIEEVATNSATGAPFKPGVGLNKVVDSASDRQATNEDPDDIAARANPFILRSSSLPLCHPERGRKPDEGPAVLRRLRTENQVLRTAPRILRLGLRYVRGLREPAARAILREREKHPFSSITDLARRVPELHRNELVTLAEIGALNSVASHEPGAPFKPGFGLSGNVVFDFATDQRPSTINAFAEGRRQATDDVFRFHRRDALWEAEKAARPEGELLQQIAAPDAPSPLVQMTASERLVADFRGTGMTVGPHPMSYCRPEMNRQQVLRAIDLPNHRNGKPVRVAGCVIVRQRPGTAHGFVFLSLEDETGIANVIIMPDMFERNRLLLISEQFLLIEGTLQNVDNVTSVKATRVIPLHPQLTNSPNSDTARITAAETSSHDFH